MTESSIFDVQDLRAWLEYPTWSLREGLFLLAGIDPHRSDCISSNESCTTFNSSIPPGTLPHDAGWNRIGYRPRGWEVGSDGVPCRVNGPVCSHEDFVALGKLMEHWHRTPAHDGMTRATPAHFIGWAESANLAPPWLDAVRCAGYLPSAPAVAAPEPVAAPAEAVPVTPKGLQKREMVKRHAARWPTIKTDMQDAAKNGLAAAAKAGERGWREAAALDWARERSRLLSAPEPGTLDAVMGGGFPSRRHTLAR